MKQKEARDKFISKWQREWIITLNEDSMEQYMESQPGLVLRTIIDKLKDWNNQKKQLKEVKNKIWKRTQKENFGKSLDSKSFVFFKSEKKNMNTKCFLREIKLKY